MSKTTYRNVDAMPTWKLAEILSSGHCVGIDGADYYPVKEQLQIELYKRQAADSERLIAEFYKQQKELQKHQASAHKRKLA